MNKNSLTHKEKRENCSANSVSIIIYTQYCTEYGQMRYLLNIS